jgi:hypothetical protein
VRIVVAEAREPGAARPTPYMEALTAALRERGHEVEAMALPFRADGDLRAQAAAWRMLDVSLAGGRPIDLLIAAGFPAYFARHPRKVAWLPAAATPPPELAELDARMRGECARVVTAPMYDPRLVEQLLG